MTDKTVNGLKSLTTLIFDSDLSELISVFNPLFQLLSAFHFLLLSKLNYTTLFISSHLYQCCHVIFEISRGTSTVGIKGIALGVKSDAERSAVTVALNEYALDCPSKLAPLFIF